MDEKGDDNKQNIQNSIQNNSQNPQQDAQTEPGVNEEVVPVPPKIFDFLIPSDVDPTPFSYPINENENENIFLKNNEYIKYAICILLKDNSFENCILLQKTLEGIINKNMGALSTFQIEPKDIYIVIFVNKIIIPVEDNDNDSEKLYLVKRDSLKKITGQKNFLKIPQTIKDENREITIDIICKKHYMTDVESLQCYYNYVLKKLRPEGKPIASSIITAGVVPNDDCLQKLIQISYHSNSKNQNKGAKYAIAVPALEVNENNNLFGKIAQYDRIHFNIFNMSFYGETATVPISSLLNTMIIDNKLMGKLQTYYTDIKKDATIDYHDYDLGLFLYGELVKIDYYCNEILGHIVYNDAFDYGDYKDTWVNKLSGYYGNFFNILKTFANCNGLPIVQKVFMFFQIIGLLIEFIYPSLSILVIYSIFYEAFCITDIRPAVFMTLLYITLYLGSGACSMITTTNTKKLKNINFFFLIFMEIYYLFFIICSIPAMDNINKFKQYKPFDIGTSKYEFNIAACFCLILFTFIIALVPIILKIGIVSKYIVQMFIYLLLGSPSSTSNFLIAKIWLAPGTSGGYWKEESQGITIIFFFLFNLFLGFLSFYNYTRELRAKCVMGLAIFYLIYLFFKTIAIMFPLLCGIQLVTNKDDKIKSKLWGENDINSINDNNDDNDDDNRNNNPLENSSDRLNSENQKYENDEEKLDGSNHENNKYQENNYENENNNINNSNQDNINYNDNNYDNGNNDNKNDNIDNKNDNQNENQNDNKNENQNENNNQNENQNDNKKENQIDNKNENQNGKMNIMM